jgi:hypothetical protein
MKHDLNDSWEEVTVWASPDDAVDTVRGRVKFLSWCRAIARQIERNYPARQARVKTRKTDSGMTCCVVSTGVVWDEDDEIGGEE